jgi:DNA (cytosine-5)-methyltransferase 1
MGISTVFMAQMNGGFNTTHAKSIEDPMTTALTILGTIST